MPLDGDIDYSQVVSLDLGSVTPSVAGPKRPQDRIELGQVAHQFSQLFSQPATDNGFGQNAGSLLQRHRVASQDAGSTNVTLPSSTDDALTLGHGDVLDGRHHQLHQYL